MKPSVLMVLFIIPAIYSHTLETRNGGNDEKPVPSNFAIRNIRWRLHAHARSGQIQADVEVHNHDDYNVRWYIVEPGDVDIPITDLGAYTVYSQRFWTKGRAYIGGHMMLRPVPPVDDITIKLEITSTNYGPTLWYTFSVAVSNDHYGPMQVMSPDTLEPVSYANPKYTFSDEDQVRFEFVTVGPMLSAVHGFRAEPADGGNYIFDDVTDLDDDPRGDRVVVGDTDPDEGRTETTTALIVSRKDGQYIYKIRLETDDAILEYYILLLKDQHDSIYSGLHMAIETCSGIPVRASPSGDVTIELSTWRADCVRCIAVSPNGASMRIARDGIPIGSGASHVVFWYRMQADVTVASIVFYEHMYTYMYQSNSYAGEYTCIATTIHGQIMERTFTLEFV